MIPFLFALLIICLVLYVVFWALGQVPLPPPIRVILVVLVALILIYYVTGYLPAPGFSHHGWPRP